MIMLFSWRVQKRRITGIMSFIRLAEKLDIGNETYILSSQEFADGTREEGYRYQTGFSYEDTPVWQYLVNGVEIAKEAAIKQKENTAAVCYRIKNRSRSAVSLTVTPFYQFAPKGEEPAQENRVMYTEGCVESGGMKLYYRTDGCDTEMPETEEAYYYSYGRMRRTAQHRKGKGMPPDYNDCGKRMRKYPFGCLFDGRQICERK